MSDRSAGSAAPSAPSAPTGTSSPAKPPTEVRPTPDRTLRGRVRRVRSRIREKPRLNACWRVGIGVLGTLVLVLGVIAIPYPGPGWLIVFAGLGILASEFTWAGRVLRFARRHYDRWAAWVWKQNLLVKALLGLLTFLVVVATLWLFGAFGLVARWVGLGGPDWAWLQSPIGG